MHATRASVPAAATKPGPTGVTIGFVSGGVRLSWNPLAGAKTYQIIISKRTYYGPYAGHYTTSTAITLPWAWFPYASTGADQPYQFEVSAKGGFTTAASFVHIPSSISKVSTKRTSAARSKMAECAKNGGAVLLVTAASGGVVGLAATWIPVIGEVTWAGVAATAAATGGATFLACSIGLPT